MTLLFSLLLSTLPSLSFGVIISSCLLLWFDSGDNWLKLPKNPVKGALIGILCGLISPFGLYGCFPIARRLLIAKVPTAIAISWLLSAPTLNFWTLWLTYRVFADEPSFFWWRIGIVLIITTIVAIIFSMARRKVDAVNKLRTREGKNTDALLDSPLIQSGSFLVSPRAAGDRKLHQKIDRFLDNFLKEFGELSFVLILGCIVTTIILETIEPRSFLLVTDSAIVGIVRSMLYSFILSLGANDSTSFAVTLGAIVPKSAIISFLVFSGLINLKSIGLLLLTFRSKVAVYLLLLLIQLTFLLSAAIAVG